jgi:hypothetical protein
MNTVKMHQSAVILVLDLMNYCALKHELCLKKQVNFGIAKKIQNILAKNLKNRPIFRKK